MWMGSARSQIRQEGSCESLGFTESRGTREATVCGSCMFTFEFRQILVMLCQVTLPVMGTLGLGIFRKHRSRRLLRNTGLDEVPRGVESQY